MDLVYRAVDSLLELGLGECAVRATRGVAGTYWQLWIWTVRTDTGEPFYVAVPVHPRGGALVIGPSGRRTWGLTEIGSGVWRVTPSIDVVGAKRADGSRSPSLWHETPRIVGVPAGERWCGAPA